MKVYAFKEDDWVAYDDVNTLKLKCDYINSLNLAGVMFWDLSMDDFTGDFCDLGRFPLISLFQTCLIAGCTFAMSAFYADEEIYTFRNASFV